MNYNYNPADKGWNEMRKLLDREMPAQAPLRERRAGRHALPVLLLLISAAGGWGPHRLLRQSYEPIARLSVTTAVAENKPFETGKESRREEYTPAAPANPQNTLISPKFQARNVFYLSEASVKTEAESKENPVFSEKNIEKQEISIPALPVKLIRPTTNKVEPRKSSLQPVPVAPEECFAARNPSAGNAKVEAVKHKNFTLGLSMAAGTEKLKELDFLAGGLVAEWNAPGGKIGLRTGLMLGNYSPSTNKQPVALVKNYQYSNAVGHDVAYYDNKGNRLINYPAQDLSNQVEVPIERQYRLEIPLLFTVRPVKKLALFGGLTAGRVLSTEAALQSYSGSIVLRPNGPNPDEGLNELALGEIPNWQLSMSAGFGYRPFKNFGIDLFYHNPLKNKGRFLSDNAESEIVSQYSNLRYIVKNGNNLFTLQTSIFF